MTASVARRASVNFVERASDEGTWMPMNLEASIGSASSRTRTRALELTRFDGRFAA
jgi:hypothetical protein